MKKLLASWAIVVIVCIASAATLAACNIELKEMDGNEYYASSEKERSVELVDLFFEETLKRTNFVVTCANKDGELQYTETVKGSDSFTLYKDGAQIYAFKKGGFFYTAFITQKTLDTNVVEERYYYCSDSAKKGYYADNELGTMKEMYKKNHCIFMNSTDGVGIVNDLADEDATYNCMTSLERISGYATSSLDFTYTSANNAVTISASAEENVVKNLHIIIKDAEGKTLSDLIWTFAYGGAHITLPDVDAWDEETSAE